MVDRYLKVLGRHSRQQWCPASNMAALAFQVGTGSFAFINRIYPCEDSTLSTSGQWRSRLFCRMCDDHQHLFVACHQTRRWLPDRSIMIFGYRIGIVAFLLLVAIFWLHVLRPLRPTHQAHFGHDIAAGRYAPSILNATLGVGESISRGPASFKLQVLTHSQFEKVFILNLPERTDRRDAMTLSAAVSNIDLTWIDGVLGTHVPDKVLPQNSKGKALPKGNIGSWRAHMNALQRYLNLTYLSNVGGLG